MQALRVSAFLVALLLAGSVQAWSQQHPHAIGSDELNAAVIGHADGLDRERERIRSLLQRPEVRAVARDHGIDLQRLEAGVGTLGAAGIQRLAPHVRAAEARLQEGGIRISTVALILLLLLVIAVAVVAS